MSDKYFKVTNSKEIHHDHVYHDGLNVLKKFNESNASSGFYFTTIEHIHKFYSFGTNLREITVPETNPQFKMVLDPRGDRWKANKIILGKKYSLFDPKTYQIFGLNMTQNKYLVDMASSEGHIDFLNFWIYSGIDLKYSYLAMDCASANNLVLVLAWWKESNRPMKYTEESLNSASKNGNYHVMNWWKNSGLELKYTESAIDNASKNGHIYILQWWKESGMEFRYSTDAMDRASETGQVEVLEWWHQSGFHLKYSYVALEYASINGHCAVLKWWKNSGLFLKYNPKINDIVLTCGGPHVVEIMTWWNKSCLL